MGFSLNSLPFALSRMNTLDRRKYLFLFLTAYHLFETHQAPFTTNHYLKHFHLSFRSCSWNFHWSSLFLLWGLCSTDPQLSSNVPGWTFPEVLPVLSRAEQKDFFTFCRLYFYSHYKMTFVLFIATFFTHIHPRCFITLCYRDWTQSSLCKISYDFPSEEKFCPAGKTLCPPVIKAVSDHTYFWEQVIL